MTASNGILQAATVIAKTTQTLVGSVIGCAGADWLTFFFTYTKGDETGLIITPSVLRVSDGTAYPYAILTASSGAFTITATKLTLTGTTSSYMTFDVRGVDYMKFTQGGSNNDGTPTGTLAASYAIK